MHKAVNYRIAAVIVFIALLPRFSGSGGSDGFEVLRDIGLIEHTAMFLKRGSKKCQRYTDHEEGHLHSVREKKQRNRLHGSGHGPKMEPNLKYRVLPDTKPE